MEESEDVLLNEGIFFKDKVEITKSELDNLERYLVNGFKSFYDSLIKDNNDNKLRKMLHTSNLGNKILEKQKQKRIEKVNKKISKIKLKGKGTISLHFSADANSHKKFRINSNKFIDVKIYKHYTNTVYDYDTYDITSQILVLKS